MNRKPLPVLIAALFAGAMLSACSQQPSPADTAASTSTPATAAASATPAAAPAAGDVFRFRIGSFDAVAMKDGDIDVANDGKVFGVGRPTADVAALVSAAGLPTDMLHLSIQPLLVRAGDRVLLFDTGAGDVQWARAGRLQDALRAAGVEAAQVTDILISHRHPDHVGGLLTREGTLAFPNAAIHLSAPEWEALKGDADAISLVRAITPKVATFQPGAQVVPGVVTAVAVNGHTPGHSAYEIASGENRLLYIGDSAHHHVISVQRPQWTVQYDENAPEAEASRRALLQRAADGRLRVYAVHFPFPGIGHVAAQGESFTWVPER
jgi:glyoxylase-like metal-dependent hydrolase (beta-lactamase superfamily II)